ncbi:hypothetical protein K3R08_004114 [Escherichia albertii]|nr:hypothetical protein [Escherichia albertii]
MAKIIRKKNNGCEIPEHNYQQIITDLIGVRALYLLKKLKKNSSCYLRHAETS